MRTQCIWDLQCCQTFRNCWFVLHTSAFTKFLLRWCAPWKLWWTLFKSSFSTLDTLCRLHLQCFQTFRNCCLFRAFLLLRYFYSGDKHHANHGKPSLDHHLQHCRHIVYQIYNVLKPCKITVCFAHFGFYQISSPVSAHHANYGERCVKSSFPILRKLCISDLPCFQTFRNFSLFCIFWLWGNFYSDDSHQWKLCVNVIVQVIISNTPYTLCISDLQRFETFRNCFLFCTFWLFTKFLLRWYAPCQLLPNNSLDHHFRYCAQCIWELKCFHSFSNIAVCFTHFGFYEISTPVMRTMLTMVNVVQISHFWQCAKAVYIRFTVFSNFSKLQFVLHILAFTKFLLPWCAPCSLCQIKFYIIIFNIPQTVYIRYDNRFETFRNCCLFCNILAFMKFHAPVVRHPFQLLCKLCLNNHFQHCPHCV